MKSPADSHEMTVLESKGILIHDQVFHAVLTDRRIILTRYVDNKLSIRSIYFADIQKIDEDMNYSGDPVLVVVTSSANVKTKKVVLHFSRKNFPDPFKERSLWASEINRILRSVSVGSPAPVLKKPPVTKVFCIKCGTQFTDGSAFCTKCGTKIIYPDQPLPPQEIDTSVIKRVKITEIPVRRIEQSQKNPKEISGEELAEQLSINYQQAQQCQINIMAINQELARRKETKPVIHSEVGPETLNGKE